MKTRKELKTMAKQQIKGNIGMLFVIMLIIGVISGAATAVLSAVTFGIGFSVVYRDSPLLIAVSLLLAALTIFMHRENVRRLLKGEERKTNLFGKSNQS